MKRIAIILGSPFPKNSEYFLRGVSVDVLNYYRFLRSSSGGSWKESEVKYVKHLTRDRVKDIHRLCRNADIAVIIFSGHGYMQAGESYICINPRQDIKVSDLTTSAHRQINIIDACRKDYEYEHFEGIGDIGFFFDNTRPQLGRDLYDFHLKKSPHGHFTMYSCSENQVSIDSENGGVFSYTLLNSVKEWESTSNNIFLSADNAFQITSSQLYIDGAKQIPEYTHSGLVIPSLPFTVSPRAYIRKFERDKSYKSQYR